MKLVTVAEMQSIEREADASGLSYAAMMENAGRGVAEEINNTYSQYIGQRVIAFVGSGNNGGDALVALSHLSRAGWKSTAYIVKERQEEDPLVSRVISDGGDILQAKDDSDYSQLKKIAREAKVVIDGILGTGIKLPLKSELADRMARIKDLLFSLEEIPTIVAVDTPSGIDCDNGDAAAESLPADMTITMAAVKVGLFEFPAAEYVGEIRVVSIGNIDHLKSWQSVSREVITKERVTQILPKRPINAHKGTFGTALIVGGSINYTGAVLLAGEAAYRGGAGLVTIAIPSTLYLALAGQLPEATWILLPEEMGVIASHGARIINKTLRKVDAMLLGPGFGLEDTSRDFLANLLGFHSQDLNKELGFVSESSQSVREELQLPPLVIDADGLKLISQFDKWYLDLPGETILTPHPGEMSIISGLPKSEILRDRLGITYECASNWGHIVILKGAHTIIGSPDGRMAIIPIATPALARAGTGDVLAGLIVGLRAQGVTSYDSAIAGAWIHGRAGLIAAEKYGNTASIIASDILNSIPDVMTDLNN
jgi:ADP-dependent NAD(P)H-hydrate dehydratase / NAD(P)H-hydrate epimerase